MKSIDKYIPYFFVAFFLIIILVDLLYIYIAQVSYRGVVEKNSYYKGLNYSDVIESRKLQNDMHWKVLISYQNLTDRNVLVEIDIKDKDNKVIKNLDITAYVSRPTQIGYDFNEKMIFNPSILKYNKVIAFPLYGQWDLEILAKYKNVIFKKKLRLLVKV